MILQLHDLLLPLRHPFTTANGTLTTQHNLLVSLSDGQYTGYGESPTSRSWPQLATESARAALEKCRPVIESLNFEEPAEFWAQMQPHLGHHPFALCALDQAAHDLWGRRHQRPIWQLWGLHDEALPPTNYTLGLDTTERMVAKLHEFCDWPLYKIKLGSGNDLALMQELRQHTTAVLRVDANTGWTVEQTLCIAPALKALGVEFIEQPLPRDDWAGMQRLHRECALPIVADEACQTESDIERCAACFSGVNIKLVKAGGLTPARRMIQRACDLGLRVMVGCMCESSIGISATAQLLPLLDDADLDGALLLAEDIADGVVINQGRVTLNRRPGTGARLNAAGMAIITH
jgi:L-alanine-DL-glutamate epimerase-like enolase superfamily enzyme